MHPHGRGLALLLSIGSLPIACNKDSEESDSKASDPTGGSDGHSSSGAPVTGSGTTGGVPTTSGDSVGGTTSTSGEPTTAASVGFITTNTTSGTSDGETGMLPPVTDPTCIAYGDHLTQCYPRYERYFKYYAYYCQYIKMYAARTDGQACVDALEAQFVCLTKVACGDYMKDPPPCAAEIAAVDPACPSLVEEGTSSGGGSSGGGSTGP